MNSMRKCFVWFCMLTKRLLFQWSFILILCIIPIVMPLANVFMNQESGVFHVALCNEDKSERSAEIIESILNRESVVRFTYVNTREEAERAVRTKKADAAWIIKDGFRENLIDHVNAERTGAVIDIIEQEETIITKISRELLFGAIYRDLSYEIYRDFSLDVLSPDVPEEEMRSIYENQEKMGQVIVSRKLNTNKPVKSDVNYLTAPIRGILSLVMLLCSLAAAIYHLKDRKDGRFDWMSHRDRIAPAFASCLGAACISGAVVFIALIVSDVSTGFVNELLSMLLYIPAVTGFSLLLCVCIKSPGKLGALIPGIMIAALALSPIFFELAGVKIFSMLLPTYYYLYSVFDAMYYLYSIVYSIAIYIVAIAVNHIIAEKCQNKSLI